MSVDRSRTAVGVVAFLSLVLAYLAAHSASLARLLPTERLIAILGNDYFLLALLGGLALAVALTAVYSGRESNRRRASMPDPERPLAVPAAGDEFDAAVDQWRVALPVIGRSRRAAIHRRLRSAAVETVARVEACSRSEAERRVAEGTWTTDPLAATYLQPESPPTPSIAARVRALRWREPWTRRCARRAATAIADCGGVSG